MTEEVMMIPTQEFERLQDFYKGQITQSALLNKAGRLAAEKHLILKNPKIPNSVAVKMSKPLAREQARLTKRIRLGTTPTAGVGAPDEDEAMVDSPLESLLKRIIKKEAGTPGTPATSRIKKEAATPGPSGLKPPIPPKPGSSKKTPSKGFKKRPLSESTKTFLKSVGVDPKYYDDGDDQGSFKVDRGKQPLKKAKQTETQKLWEGWDEPTKKKLTYGKKDQ